MSAVTAILNHGQAMQTLAGRSVPMAASSQTDDGSGNAGNSSATISANDFLTLLVTEMQNQDPTANTDPNEYINQLVQVNSLEQLIGINQTLTTALGPAQSTAASSAQTAARVAAPAPSSSSAAAAPIAAPLHPSASILPGSVPSAAPHVFGNLSAPAASPSALRVAHALDGSQPAHAAVPFSIHP